MAEVFWAYPSDAYDCLILFVELDGQVGVVEMSILGENIYLNFTLFRCGTRRVSHIVCGFNQFHPSVYLNPLLLVCVLRCTAVIWKLGAWNLSSWLRLSFTVSRRSNGVSMWLNQQNCAHFTQHTSKEHLLIMAFDFNTTDGHSESRYESRGWLSKIHYGIVAHDV